MVLKMNPEQLMSMRLEMEKQALSASTLSRGAKSLGGFLSRGARSAGRAVKEFGQRQAHGFTGHYGDSLTTGLKRKEKKLLKKMMGSDGKKLTKLRGALKDTVTRRHEMEAARKAGITSLPGLAKGLKSDAAGTGKALLKHQTGGTGVGRAMTFGVPAAFAASDLRKGDESEDGGKTIGQKLVTHGTRFGAGLATGSLAFVPGMVTASALEGGATKAYNKLTGRSAKKNLPDDGVAQ